MIPIGSLGLSLITTSEERAHHGFRTWVHDWDFIATKEEYIRVVIHLESQGKLIHSKPTRRGQVLFAQGFKPLEFEIIDGPDCTGQGLMQYADFPDECNAIQGLGNVQFEMPTMDMLYALKLSHRYLKNSKHFQKTRGDIKAFRSYLGRVEVHPNIEKWLKLREEETYSYAHPKLNQTKKNFFSDDNINYIYDHDTIHEAVKHLGAPAFEYIKEDTAEVKCSKAKFFAQPEKIKLYTVLEESYVLALERCLIPFNFSQSPEWAFKKALEKVCTSIASGWWREYAWENYDEVVKLYSDDYVTKFERARIAGLIKPYKEAA